MIIQPFDIANIDQVAAMAARMWGKAIVHNLEFTREVVLNWFYDKQLSLQACDDDGSMQAIAFASLKKDINISEQWIEQYLNCKDEGERTKVLESTAYLKRTEEELLSLMDNDCAKLSLFMSKKQGYGTPLLERLTSMLRERGMRWIYLLTDSSCSWQYYSKHGYEKVHEELVDAFSTPSTPYYCYTYRKCIDSI